MEADLFYCNYEVFMSSVSHTGNVLKTMYLGYFILQTWY